MVTKTHEKKLKDLLTEGNRPRVAAALEEVQSGCRVRRITVDTVPRQLGVDGHIP